MHLNFFRVIFLTSVLKIKIMQYYFNDNVEVTIEEIQVKQFTIEIILYSVFHK